MAKYHHGNLRHVLIQVATELLAVEGTHGLSLRKMAQKAGVSHNAPYMHFADKEAVLAAIAEEGFRLLAVEVEAAIDARTERLCQRSDRQDTRQQLIAASDAYVRFAQARPNHLQVMFAPYDAVKYPDLLAASAASLDRLFELVKSGRENGTLVTGDPHVMTKAIWSMVHGIASISIAYKTTAILSANDSAADVVSVFINYLLDGIATKD
jgi:AcrR family transcriptional regulator